MEAPFQAGAMRLARSFWVQIRMLEHPIDDRYIRAPPACEVPGVVAVVNSLINQRSLNERHGIPRKYAGEEFKRLSEEQTFIKVPDAGKNIASNHRCRR
jgi:hypothetical protein